MKCERCGSTTSVEKHDVDGFTGYLCEDCAAVWDAIRTNEQR
ncbi:MAG: hypothetical protein ACQEQY_08205 [Halobacteriota archaeon]